MRRTFFALLAVSLLVPVVLAQPKAEPARQPQPADAGAAVYQNVVRSTVWVHSDRGGGRSATGSGSLVDKGRRLILTNYHVVGNVKNATVYFAAYDGKKLIAERKYYLDRSDKLGIPGEVVEVDKEGDLALVRVDRLPDGVEEITLAKDSPEPGQGVHSIGNPGKSGALWVYTPGKVRQVYNKKWKAKLDERNTLSFEAKVIETDSPTNPGDSGGPLVNDRGELVGVTQGGAIDAQALSLFIELSEVKRLINRRSVQLLRSDTPPDDPPKKEPEKREKAFVSRDTGKFFSPAAWKTLAPAAEKLFKEKNVDLFIETLTVPPKVDVKKLSTVPPEDREKAYKEIVDARLKNVNFNGVYLFITKTPPTFYLLVTGPITQELTPTFPDMLKTMLQKNFVDRKYDEGLRELIEMTLQATGLEEKAKEKK